MGGDAEIEREIRQRLAETLARFGLAGSVTLSGGIASVVGGGPTIATHVGNLAAEWARMPDDERQRRLNEVARKLAGERRNHPATRSATTIALPHWVVPLAVGSGLLLALAGGWLLYRRWALAEAERNNHRVVQDYDQYEKDRSERAARVCEATRSRVMRGAAVGPSDVEGWVVELWLLRDPAQPTPATDPVIGRFVAPVAGQDKSRLVWVDGKELAKAEGPDTTVALVETNVPEKGAPIWRGVRLVLTGRYVVPYFDETQRQEYLRFARALTESLGAEYAALYARCADSHSHHLGSWFRGPTPGGALTSLLFFVGSFGEHPDVRASLLVPEGAHAVDTQFAFRNLMTATAALKKNRIQTMVGTEAGMITGTDDHPSTISFPFRDANRASRASRIIARELGIGENR